MKRRGSPILTEESVAADLPVLSEILFAAELVLLHAAPVYYGWGVPRGDGSGVILIPAFLCSDLYLTPLHRWLGRIGYSSFFSGIGFNTDCPNLLIRSRLDQTIDNSLMMTGRSVHLIGHSLGGIIARSVAAQRPAEIASVITLAAPFRGTVAHRSILYAAELVRRRIHGRRGAGVLPDCYTTHCTCNFLDSLKCALPAKVQETAVYTKDDGVVDWRYCRTDDRHADFAVSGTHVGLAFNPSVYAILAERLALASFSKKQPKARKQNSPRCN